MKKLIIISTLFLLSIVFIGCENITTESTLVSTTNSNVISNTTTEITTEGFVSTIESTLVTTSLDYVDVQLTNQSSIFYHLGEEFDKSTIEITAELSDGSIEIIPSELIQVRGFDSSTTGSKTIYLIFNKFYVKTEVYILEDYAFEIDMEYYYPALNLSGDILRYELRDIISDGFIPLLYGDARNILPISDADPSNNNNLILIYTGFSVDKSWDGGETWNREHVWPQSRLGVHVDYDNDFPSKATDIHNLKPADPDENETRSNDYFSDVDGNYFYVPRDEIKGDVARILFYMSTRYNDLNLNDIETTNSTFKTMGMLSTLLLWNELDPVDDFEKNRNEVLYLYQGNRNPFIDYPEFADLIWGTLE